MPTRDSGLAPLRVRLAHGVAWNLIGAVFNQGSTFAANVVLANTLTVLVFGEYAMVQSTVAVLSVLGQLATGYTATKYVAEFRSVNPLRAGHLLGLLGVVSGCMGLVVSFGLFFCAQWLSALLEQPGLADALRIAAVALFFSVMNGFLMGALSGLEGYDALGRSCVIGGTLYFVAAVLGARFGALEGAMAGIAIAGAIQCVLFWRATLTVAARQGIEIRPGSLRRDADILVSFALPAALNGFLSVPAIWFGHAVLVRQEGGYQSMALFTAANNFRIIALFLPNIVNNVNMSLLNYQLGLQDSRRYRRVLWVNFGLTVTIATGAAAAATLLAPWLLDLFGEEFRAAYPVLVVLMLATIPESVSLALLQVIQSRARMWFTFIGVAAPSYATLAIAAWLLIPAQHALGLAWAYAAAAAVAVAANALMVRRIGTRLPHADPPGAPNRRESGPSQPV